MLVNVWATSKMSGERVCIASRVQASRLSVDTRWGNVILDLDGMSILANSKSLPDHWQTRELFSPYFSDPAVMPA